MILLNTLSTPNSLPQNPFSRLKALNADIAKLQFLVQDYSIKTMPQWIGFTATTACNLRCPHCQTHGTDEVHKIYNRLYWSDETLKRIAEQTLPWAYEFCLTLNGEPLCTPQIIRRLDELGRYGGTLHITTNGTLFSKNILTKMLPLVGTISISIDGATEFTCETIRRGVRFKKLLNNIRLLTRTCELIPEIIHPDIRLAFTVMGSNIRDMPEIIRVAHILRVPAVDFYPIIVCYPHLHNEDMSLHKALYNTYYSLTHEMARQFNIKITMPPPFPEPAEDTPTFIRRTRMIINHLPKDYYETLPEPEDFLDYDSIEADATEIAANIRQVGSIRTNEADSIFIKKELHQIQDSFKELLTRFKSHLERVGDTEDGQIKYCDNLFRRIFINYEGDITPCCIPGRPVLGNIYKNTVEEIWNGDLYNDFRQAFYSSNPPDCCKDCRYIDCKSKKSIAYGLFYPDIYKRSKGLMQRIIQITNSIRIALKRDS